jgi:hypothetical protein
MNAIKVLSIEFHDASVDAISHEMGFVFLHCSGATIIAENDEDNLKCDIWKSDATLKLTNCDVGKSESDLLHVWVDFFDFEYEDQAYYDKDLIKLISGVKIRNFSGAMQNGFFFKFDAKFATVEKLQPKERLQTLMRSKLFD